MTDSTHEILIESINPIELPPDELVPLALELEKLTPGTPVAVGFEEEEGSGVTWVQVIHLFLPSADFVKDAAYAALCGRVMTFFKERRNRKHQGTRTHNLVVHDDEGNVIGTWSLRPNEDQAIILPPDEDTFRRPKPSNRARGDSDTAQEASEDDEGSTQRANELSEDE
jgi:hypothetical protein